MPRHNVLIFFNNLRLKMFLFCSKLQYILVWLKIDFQGLPVFMFAQFLVQERVYMQDTSFLWYYMTVSSYSSVWWLLATLILLFFLFSILKKKFISASKFSEFVLIFRAIWASPFLLHCKCVLNKEKKCNTHTSLHVAFRWAENKIKTDSTEVCCTAVIRAIIKLCCRNEVNNNITMFIWWKQEQFKDNCAKT